MSTAERDGAVPLLHSSLSAADGLILALYLAAVLAIGGWAGRGVHDATQMHLASRSLPTWTVAGSMIATELSAATFLGVPQASFSGDWSYLQLAFGALLGKAVIATTVIPRYHALRVVTVYGFIGQRFGEESRRSTAMAFVAGRVLASGVRLFIAAQAFAVLTGLPVSGAIVACGGIAALYTGFGGLRSVVYTDLLQASVFLAAALSLLWVAAGAGSFEPFFTWASEGQRTRIFHGEPWLSVASARPFGTALIGGAVLTLATSGTDHDMVQRLLGARSGRAGGRALWSSALANFPITLLFLAVGTALAFAEQSGVAPGLSGADSPVPAFALSTLPEGLRGLVFAGVFAAAMSSLDSAIAAIATTWSVDLQRRPDTPLRSLRFVSGGVSLALIGTALAMAWVHGAMQQGTGEVPSLVEFALSAMSIVYGGLLGVFALGWWSERRGNARSVRAGLVTGIGCGFALFLHPLWTGTPLIAWTWWIPISALAAASVAALAPTPDAQRRAGRTQNSG